MFLCDKMLSFLQRRLTNVFPFVLFSMLTVLLEFLITFYPIDERKVSRQGSSEKGELKLNLIMSLCYLLYFSAMGRSSTTTGYGIYPKM